MKKKPIHGILFVMILPSLLSLVFAMLLFFGIPKKHALSQTQAQNQPEANANIQTATAAPPESSDQDNALFKEEDFVPINIADIQSRRIYQEVTLEDFEVNNYNKKNITFRSTVTRKAAIQIRRLYPAPIKNSKKYLGIKILGKREDAILINPPRPIKIPEYVKEIRLWVYGKGQSGGAVYLIVKDVQQNSHLLSAGLVNFYGWRQMSIKIPKQVIQQNKRRNLNESLEVVSVLYNPGGMVDDHSLKWHYIYIDDLTAIVREKYSDKQSDQW